MNTSAAPAIATGEERTKARPSRVRYVGVDIARLLAVAGMMAAHLVATNAMNPTVSPFEQGAGELATTLTTGIAAPLFAVLGGLSAVFASRRALAAGRTGAAIGGVALRGAILILLGLALGYVVSPIVVVLVYYGVAMILAAPFVAARSWFVGLVALVVGVAGGPLNALLRQSLEVVEEAGSPSYLSLVEQPIETLRGVLVTGAYPAITWVVYLLVGMLVARALISATSRKRLGKAALSIAGIGVAVATAATLVSNWALANLAMLGASVPEGLSPAQFATFLSGQQFGAPSSPDVWAQLIAAPHSGTPLDIARTVGIALAVIGLLVFMFDAAGTRTSRVTEVFRAAGAAPLTIYTLHIVVTGLLYAPLMNNPEAVLAAGMPWWVSGVAAWGVQFAGVIVLGIILSATGKRGPLEALTSGIVRGLTKA
ncbi:MAG: heparan-alpha-glucosaminide N-acetyltransferase domain-containing protein [Leucobacter sp.]